MRRCVVWTGDDQVFFYNPTSRISLWDRPAELVGRADVDKYIQEPPHKKTPEDGPKPGEDHVRCEAVVALSDLQLNKRLKRLKVLFLANFLNTEAG